MGINGDVLGMQDSANREKCTLQSHVHRSLTHKWQRGTTDGLAITMFAAAMVANGTYTSSIFIRMCTLAGLWPRLPWILGSAGVLFFDSVVRCMYTARVHRSHDVRRFAYSIYITSLDNRLVKKREQPVQQSDMHKLCVCTCACRSNDVIVKTKQGSKYDCLSFTSTNNTYHSLAIARQQIHETHIFDTLRIASCSCLLAPAPMAAKKHEE